jgi:hypothetical protein
MRMRRMQPIAPDAFDLLLSAAKKKVLRGFPGTIVVTGHGQPNC